jgi:hypothetical protein
MFTTLHRVAQDLARLLLGTVTMPTRATLQSHLHVVIEPSNQDLRHNAKDSTISLAWKNPAVHSSPAQRDFLILCAPCHRAVAAQIAARYLAG